MRCVQARSLNQHCHAHARPPSGCAAGFKYDSGTKLCVNCGYNQFCKGSVSALTDASSLPCGSNLVTTTDVAQTGKECGEHSPPMHAVHAPSRARIGFNAVTQGCKHLPQLGSAMLTATWHGLPPHPRFPSHRARLWLRCRRHGCGLVLGRHLQRRLQPARLHQLPGGPDDVGCQLCVPHRLRRAQGLLLPARQGRRVRQGHLQDRCRQRRLHALPRGVDHGSHHQQVRHRLQP